MSFFGGNFNPKIGYKITKMPSNQASRHWKTLMTTAKSTNTTSYNGIFKAPAAYNWVQPIYGNMEASSVTRTAIVAPTTSNTNRCVPTGGSLTNAVTNDAGQTGWSQVTQSGSATITLPAGTSTAPSVTYADWIQLRSQATADGSGSMPYVLHRECGSGSGTFSGFFAGTSNTDSTLVTYVRGDSFVGNAVTTPSNLASNTGEVSIGTLIGMNFRTGAPYIRVMAFGSSTTQGGGNPIPQDTAARSWVPMLEELLRAAGLPVTIENHGLSSATTAQYLAIAKARISENAPHIALYPPFGTNDGTPTQAIVDQMFSNAMDFAETATKSGVLPVFTFLCPNSAYTAGQDAFRLSLKTRCQATPWLVLDLTTGISDTNTPQGFLSFANYDGTHTNAAGYFVQAQTAYQPMVNLIMNNFSF